MGILRGTYHWNRDNKSGDDQQSQGVKVLWAQDWWKGLHEYAVEYDGVSFVKFAFDGVIYKTVTNHTRSHPGLQQAVLFDVPYFIILNTAVGGGWPKPPDEGTIFPTYHYV